MKINFNKPKDQLKEYLKFSILGFVVILLQLFVINYFAVYSVIPDLLLIVIVLFTLREGRFSGLIFAFILSLLFDILGNDVYGLSSLSKIFVAFFVGMFYNEGKSILILSKFHFILIVFTAAIINNLIYYLFDIRETNFSFYTYLLYYTFANAIYTSLLAVPALIYYSNKRY